MSRLVAALLLALACRSAPGPPEVQQVDLDGDGRADLFETVRPDGVLASAVRAPAPGADPARTVVLAIDAIPYETFAELQREGLFAAFFPAARMIAPFPSLTNVSFTALLKAPPSAAYEDLFYDRGTGETGGGVWDRITGEYRGLAPYHDLFDWEEPRLWGAFVFLEPERVALAELHRIEEILAESDEPERLLYLGSTDGLGHALGRPALAGHMRRLDRVLERFLAAGGGSRRVVLFSDHGMSESPSRMFGLEVALAEGGFRLADRIEDEADVVAPAYGLVGSIQLYTTCGREAAVGRAVARAEGADFAVWRESGGVGAADGRGSADPLDRPAAEYPDLRRRVAAALADHTLRPANVLVSLEDGWHYGSPLFDAVVDLEGTHGSASASQSVGFLASNVDRTPESLAAEDVYPYLGLSREPEGRPPAPPPCPSDAG